MFFYPLNYWRQMIYFNGSSFYIFDYKQGDVNGDGYQDYVYLMGDRPFGLESPFVENVTLVILDGRTNIYSKMPLRANAGYNPTLFLGDFTGDHIDDILISLDSGGSGGFTCNYVYSYKNNKFNLLFDFEKFNELYEYEVNYKDNYKVEVTNKNLEKVFIIDISRRDTGYLADIYDENGKLKAALQGEVTALSGVYPIDFQRDGIYELYVIQRVIGKFNADTLGFVETALRWAGTDFEPLIQTLAVPGTFVN